MSVTFHRPVGLERFVPTPTHGPETRFVVASVQWTRFVRLHDGTRGSTYGTPVAAQVAAMRSVCAAPEPRIVLRNETAQFRYPFEYLARTEPACAGKTVVVCAEEPGPFARACPPDEPGTRVLRLRYARETGGALRID